MNDDLRFNLEHGYLSKTTLAENIDEMDYDIIDKILSQMDCVDGDKIECYHGCLHSGLTDGEMVFDYLILYKTAEGFKPMVVKNGVSCGCYMNYFEKYFEPSEIYFSMNELVDFVCHSSREKLYKFLDEKYNNIRQEVLLF